MNLFKEFSKYLREYSTKIPSEIQFLKNLSETKKFLKVNGKLVAMEEVLSECKLILYYFSASWCKPCKLLIPSLKTIQRKDSGIVIIFVSQDRDKAEMETFFKRDHGNWYSILYHDGARRALTGKFQVEKVPQIIVVDKSGKIITKSGVKETKKRNMPWEVLYVSLDTNESHMVDLYKSKHPSWLAVPFQDSVIQELQMRYSITSMPQVIPIKLKTGEVISKNGKGEIEKLGVNVLVTWSE